MIVRLVQCMFFLVFKKKIYGEEIVQYFCEFLILVEKKWHSERKNTTTLTTSFGVLQNSKPKLFVLRLVHTVRFFF